MCFRGIDCFFICLYNLIFFCIIIFSLFKKRDMFIYNNIFSGNFEVESMIMKVRNYVMVFCVVCYFLNEKIFIFFNKFFCFFFWNEFMKLCLFD